MDRQSAADKLRAIGRAANMRIPEAFPASISYLGDGAYVGHDSMQIWVAAERDGLVHRVALGASELAALVAYAQRLGLLPTPGPPDEVDDD